MNDAPTPDRTLQQQLRRTERRRRWRAMALIAPLFLFTVAVYVVPIGMMLLRSVDNPEIVTHLPRTAALIAEWDGETLPGEPLFAALAAELREAYRVKATASVAKRLNYEISGVRSLITRTSRALSRGELPHPARDAMIGMDPRWGELATWRSLRRAAPPQTPFYLLAAVDRQVDDAGDVVPVPADQAIYVDIFARTLGISAVVTAVCLLIGFPVAYLLATVPPRIGNWLMICVLLPFWTSLLVRTSAWVVLLQKNGLINSLLQSGGVIDEPLTLLFNRPGVYVGLVHILLPFMILPLYSVMLGISPAYMRAAESLGAHPAVAFVRVYLPQTVPGIAAGGLLVFILSIGYYITPALIGGPKDQMISYFIAYHTDTTLNWGLASALGVILLLATGLLYAVYNRLTGGAGIRMA